MFRYFTDTARWALWWGQGSTIDAPGGRLFVRHPDGTESAGEPSSRSSVAHHVHACGFVSGKPSARCVAVTIVLEPLPRARAYSRLTSSRKHPKRTRAGLAVSASLFSNIVADEANAGAAGAVDTWFQAWSEPDAQAREAALANVAAADVHFKDRFSAVDGVPDLVIHLGAAQRFMPGLQLHRDGDVRHCQGMVLADWVARTTDGQERARGTNVFLIRPCGLFESVTGFWSAHPRG